MWANSARRLQRVLRRIENEFGDDSVPVVLARSAFRKEAHTTMLYVVLAIAAAATALADRPEAALLFSFVLVPVILSVVSARDFVQESRLSEERFTIERRAEEVLTQDQLAPQRWAARLAPRCSPTSQGSRWARSTRRAPASWPATSTTCSASRRTGWRRSSAT